MVANLDGAGLLRYTESTGKMQAMRRFAGSGSGKKHQRTLITSEEADKMRNVLAGSLRICLSLIILLFLAAPAFAAKCDERGVLQDVEHYVASWGWGAKSSTPMIHLWDSPDHIAIVANVAPGSYVTIVEEREGYYRVRSPEGAAGWIGKDQLAAKLPKEPECP